MSFGEDGRGDLRRRDRAATRPRQSSSSPRSPAAGPRSSSRSAPAGSRCRSRRADPRRRDRHLPADGRRELRAKPGGDATRRDDRRLRRRRRRGHATRWSTSCSTRCSTCSRRTSRCGASRTWRAHLDRGRRVRRSRRSRRRSSYRLRDDQYVDAEAIGIDEVTLDVGRHDPVGQLLDESHVRCPANGMRLYPIVTRYAWPSELDLMARMAGLRLRERWAGWSGEPFGGTSRRHVSVYQLGTPQP